MSPGYMKSAKKALLPLSALLAAACLLIQGLAEFRDTRRLLSEGARATGKVVDGRTVYRPRGRTRYYVTVEFGTPAGQSFRREIQVDDNTHRQGRDEGEVTVWYLPAAPEVCQAGARPQHDVSNLVLGGLLFVVGVFLVPSIWRPGSRKELADTVSEHFDTLCDTDLRYEPVDPAAFSHLDLGFYNSSQRQFEEHGFLHLEDVEEVRRKPFASFARTFLRVLVSRDGTRVATIFQVKPGWKLRLLGAKETRVYGVGTLFSNATSVDTDNAEGASMLDPVPGFNTAHLPAGSSLEMVLNLHEKRLAAHAAQQAGAVPLRIQCAEELHRLMLESHARKAAFRRQHGLSKQALERLGGVSANPVINDLHKDLAKRTDARNREVA